MRGTKSALWLLCLKEEIHSQHEQGCSGSLSAMGSCHPGEATFTQPGTLNFSLSSLHRIRKGKGKKEEPASA
jgi:hypothetical protein